MGLVTPVDPVPVGQLGRVHFTGIGGAGMSGIARIMLARGVRVSGSDAAGRRCSTGWPCSARTSGSGTTPRTSPGRTRLSC